MNRLSDIPAHLEKVKVYGIALTVEEIKDIADALHEWANPADTASFSEEALVARQAADEAIQNYLEALALARVSEYTRA